MQNRQAGLLNGLLQGFEWVQTIAFGNILANCVDSHFGCYFTCSVSSNAVCQNGKEHRRGVFFAQPEGRYRLAVLVMLSGHPGVALSHYFQVGVLCADHSLSR